MDFIGRYETKPFPKSRKLVVESVELARQKNHISGLIELDVTKARELIRAHKQKTGDQLSFTAWILKCIGQAVSEHKQVHALRKGKKLILFDEVDITTMVESVVEDNPFPVVLVVRKTNEKSFQEIHTEIRDAQTGKKAIIKPEDKRKAEWLLLMPKFLRNLLFWRRLKKKPFFRKKTTGTVLVTAVGMFGKGISGGGLTPSHYPLAVILGGIAKKPGVVTDQIKIREFLCMTLMFDHDVVDGAPAARFGARLAELVQGAYGMKEE